MTPSSRFGWTLPPYPEEPPSQRHYSNDAMREPAPAWRVGGHLKGMSGKVKRRIGCPSPWIAPDILSIATDRLAIISERGIEEAPTQVGEVLSPSAATRRSLGASHPAAGAHRPRPGPILALRRLRSVDTARVDVAFQTPVRIDAVLQVGDADHDVVDVGQHGGSCQTVSSLGDPSRRRRRAARSSSLDSVDRYRARSRGMPSRNHRL